MNNSNILCFITGYHILCLVGIHYILIHETLKNKYILEKLRTIQYVQWKAKTL